MSGGFNQISINQRLQGGESFLEIQTLNDSQLQMDNNAKLSLSEDITILGNLVVNGSVNGTNSNDNALSVATLTTPVIKFPDNNAQGLKIIADDDAEYIRLNSTNGGEKIEFKTHLTTEGNSITMGSNQSRGTLQYANIVNSSIGTTNTLSANTTGNSATATLLQNARTIGGVSFNGSAGINLNGVNQAGNQNTSGTASAWTSARTTNFTSLAGDALGSVSLSGTGTTTAQLKTPFYDESNANAKKLILSNTTSGHTSTGLQQRIDFANEFLPQMNQTDDLVGRLTMAKDIFSITQFQTNATNTSQATTFTRGDDSFPKMNGMLRFLQSSAGANISIERDGTFDGNNDQKALPSGIDFKLGSGSYVGSGLGGLQGGIRSNYTATEVGNTKVFASSFVNNASREMSLLLKPDELSLTNMGIIKFNGAGTISSTDSNLALTPGSGKQVILGTKVRVGSIAEAGDEEDNPYLMGIEDPTAINSNTAVTQLLSFKYHINNGSQNRHFGFEGDQASGGIQLVKNIFGSTTNDGYTGTRTKTKLIQFNGNGFCSVNGAPLQDGLGLIQPTTSGSALGFSHPDDTSRKWTFLIGSNFDCTFSGATGCNNLTFNGKARATLNAQGGIAGVTGSTDVEITASSGDVKITASDDIVLECGQVGIGVASPKAVLNTENVLASGNNTIRTSGTANTQFPTESLFLGKSTVATDGHANNNNWGLSIGTVWDGWSYIQALNTRTSDYYNLKLQPNGGNVGIGTTNPLYPLHISASATSASINNSHKYTTNNVVYVGNASHPVSVRVENAGIWVGNEIIYNSDERIKTDITLIDDDRALQQVLDLESREYNYLDPKKKTEFPVIGFIAQEVKAVIPNAVSIQTNWVPDELRLLEVLDWSENILTIDIDFEDNHTGRCKFFVSEGEEEGEEEVSIECEKDEDGNKTNKYKFEKEWKYVFFHGKEVNDFHTINKDMIFATHHSAIQQLDRNDKAQEEKIVTQAEKIVSLETQLKELIARVSLNELALKSLLN